MNNKILTLSLLFLFLFVVANVNAGWTIDPSEQAYYFIEHDEDGDPLADGSIWLNGSFNDTTFYVYYNGNENNSYRTNLCLYDINISNVTYVRDYNVVGKETEPRGLFIDRSGTKMYVTGSSGDSVDEYTLSTRWNISSATYVGEISVGAKETYPQTVFFKPDGKEMYIAGNTGKIQQYTLSTAWDVSTATWTRETSKLIATDVVGATISGLYFNYDGTKLYFIDFKIYEVEEYSLSTPWDISTISYIGLYNVETKAVEPSGLFLNDIGTQFIISNYQGDYNTNLYSLSTAWKITTASYSSGYYIQDSRPIDININKCGSKMYVLGYTNDKVYEYTLNRPYTYTTSYGSAESGSWEIDGITYTKRKEVNMTGTFEGQIELNYNQFNSTNITIIQADYVPPDITINSPLNTTYNNATQLLNITSDGDTIWYNWNGTNVTYEVNYYDAWNVSSATYLQEISVGSKEQSPQGVFFKPDGTKMYVVGSSGDSVDEWDLADAWNVSSATYLQEISVTSKETNPQGVFFKPDGTKMYVVGANGDSVDEWDLADAWNVSSATYLQEISVASKETNPRGVFFKPDGTKMYVVGGSGDSVDEWDLADAWNVSSATYLQEISVTSKETNPTGVFFKPDGTKMYVVGNIGISIDEWDLADAWNVSSATYLQEISVASKELSPTGVFFKPDGTKMYVVGGTGISIDEWNLVNHQPFPLITFSEGTHTLTAWANDSFGNVNTTSVTFTIDTTAPTLVINTPTNTTYNSATQLLNITSNGDTIWYNWNGTNVTYTTPVSITFAEGGNTINVWANDTIGNSNTTSVTFTIDTIAPTLVINTPTNTTYNNATQLLNITSDGDSIWYNWNGTNHTYTSPFNVTFTEGTHTLHAWTNDTVNNVNTTSIIFTVDTSPPIITINSPINDTYITKSILVNITTNDTYSDIHSVWYSYNGGNESYTTPVYKWYENNAYNITVWANDTLGNINSTSRIFTVNGSSLFKLISPSALTYNYHSILLNITDSVDTDTIWYNWNGTNTTYTSAGNITFEEGSNTLHIWANDSVNNVTYQNFTFTIDTIAPTLVINTPTNTTYNNATQLLNITSDGDNVWYNWNGTNVTYTTPVNIIFDERENTINVWANDTIGNSNTTSVTFTIDTTAPTLVINTPTNTTYNNATQLLNITSDGDNVWYNWNGTNVTYTTPVNITFNEGGNTINVWSNDGLNNVNTTNVTFTIDTTPPLLEIITPANITYGTQTILLNITSSEDNNTIWYNFNGSNHTYIEPINVLFNEGENNLQVWVNDSLNNVNTTTRIFTVDTTPPSIEIISPQNITYGTQTILLNITSDETADTIWYNFNGSNHTYTEPINVLFNEGENNLQVWVNDSLNNVNTTRRIFTTNTVAPIITINNPLAINYNYSSIQLDISSNGVSTWYNWNGTNYSYSTPHNITFNEGSNTINVWSNNSGGVVNTTSVTFNIDITKPIININSPINTTYGTTEMIINLSATDIHIDSIWYNWNGSNVSYTTPILTTFNEGENTLTVYANDTYGNVNSTSVIFTANTIPPIITINTPVNNSYSSNTININITSNGEYTWYNWNGSNVSYTTPILTTFNQGSNTLIVWSNNTGGIINSTNVSFFIDSLLPNITIVSPTNTTYGTRIISVNLNANDTNLDKIWYNWNGTNKIYTAPENVVFEEGSNTITAYANDTYGNVKSTSITFTTDTLPPEITIYNPLNTTYPQPYVNVSFRGLDSHIDSIWLILNGITHRNLTTTNTSTWKRLYDTEFNVSDGLNTIVFYANDTLGNEDHTTLYFTVDLTPSETYLTFPSNLSIMTSNYTPIVSNTSNYTLYHNSYYINHSKDEQGGYSLIDRIYPNDDSYYWCVQSNGINVRQAGCGDTSGIYTNTYPNNPTYVNDLRTDTAASTGTSTTARIITLQYNINDTAGYLFYDVALGANRKNETLSMNDLPIACRTYLQDNLGKLNIRIRGRYYTSSGSYTYVECQSGVSSWSSIWQATGVTNQQSYVYEIAYFHPVIDHNPMKTFIVEHCNEWECVNTTNFVFEIPKYPFNNMINPYSVVLEELNDSFPMNLTNTTVVRTYEYSGSNHSELIIPGDGTYPWNYTIHDTFNFTLLSSSNSTTITSNPIILNLTSISIYRCYDPSGYIKFNTLAFDDTPIEAQQLHLVTLIQEYGNITLNTTWTEATTNMSLCITPKREYTINDQIWYRENSTSGMFTWYLINASYDTSLNNTENLYITYSTYMMVVKVLGADNNPLQGLTVRFIRFVPPSTSQTFAMATTNADGLATFDYDPTQFYRFEIYNGSEIIYTEVNVNQFIPTSGLVYYYNIMLSQAPELNFNYTNPFNTDIWYYCNITRIYNGTHSPENHTGNGIGCIAQSMSGKSYEFCLTGYNLNTSYLTNFTCMNSSSVSLFLNESQYNGYYILTANGYKISMGYYGIETRDLDINIKWLLIPTLLFILIITGNNMWIMIACSGMILMFSQIYPLFGLEELSGYILLIGLFSVLINILSKSGDTR